jgi:hypothetical protein
MVKFKLAHLENEDLLGFRDSIMSLKDVNIKSFSGLTMH